MSNLKCKICNYEHPIMISNSHLKTHNITGPEYKIKFPGSVLRVMSQESKDKIKLSKLENTTEAWNKGKKTGKNEKLSQSKKGVPNLKLRGQVRTEEQKCNIANGTRLAMVNGLSEEAKQKISKSIKDKQINGTYVNSMLGKVLSEETKNKISKASIASLEIKRQLWLNTLSNQLLIDNIQVKEMKFQNLHLKCLVCENDFSFSRQYFSNSSVKYHNSRNEKICPFCFPRNNIKSKKEIELFDFIKSLIPTENIISGNRTLLAPKELDILIPERNLAFEFCGNYWHAENVAFNRSKYHINEKHNECFDKNIRLITIFEDEWDLKQDIVKSRISHLLGKTEKIYFARKLQIKQITSKQSKEFLNRNHIQGADKPEIALGAFNNDELLSVMTFKKTNFVKGGDGKQWELNRFASSVGISVTGIAAKMLKYFQINFNKDKIEIISYSDNRWSIGNVYEKLGFLKKSNSLPGYWYICMNAGEKQGMRIHRSNFMKYRLHKIFNNENYKKENCNLSEYEIMQLEGYDRIWDCGTTKWVI